MVEATLTRSEAADAMRNFPESHGANLAPATRHVRGLDSLRFIAALWVAFSHGAAIPFKLLLVNGGQVAHAVADLSGVLFNGVAAVSVFFVISGFCIHFPSARADRIHTRVFLIRRYTRIGGPLIATWVIIACSPARVASAGQAVLWSVYCELIYYSLYPLLFKLFLSLGIETILAAATLVSVLLIATGWH